MGRGFLDGILEPYHDKELGRAFHFSVKGGGHCGSTTPWSGYER